MGANEIWRIGLDGGEPETVASGLGVPDSVKFDSAGLIVSTQVHSGQVLRIDPRTGKQTVLAESQPGAGQFDLRRRSAVRLELHRRDHRDPRRRLDRGPVAGRVELAAGSGRGRRRQAVCRRRHLLLRARSRPHLAHRGHAVHPGLSGVPARACSRWTGRVRRHHIRWPDLALPAGRTAKARCWQTDSISSTAWRSPPTERSRPPNSGRDGWWRSAAGRSR